MIEESLVTFFKSTVYAAKDIAPLIAGRVHVGKVPKNQSNKFPRIFLKRSNKESECDIDGTKNNFITDTFDLEIISNSSSDIMKLTDELWKDVHCHFGSISSSQTVKGILLESQDDNYEPKGTGGDIGLDIASFSMRVFYSST
jgi:hypothetical protein